MACHDTPTPKLQPEVCGILFLGTSLTAGYGLTEDQAFPNILATRLDSASRPFDVKNAGVPGETSAGLLERVERVITADTVPRRLIVVETGANDMLRGLPPAEFATNLRSILSRIKDLNPTASVLLLRVDPGGARYLPGQGANGGLIMDSLTTVAEEYKYPVLEDLLEGVRLNPELTQEDRMHPNSLGQIKLADNVWPILLKTLDKAGCRP